MNDTNHDIAKARHHYLQRVCHPLHQPRRRDVELRCAASHEVRHAESHGHGHFVRVATPRLALAVAMRVQENAGKTQQGEHQASASARGTRTVALAGHQSRGHLMRLRLSSNDQMISLSVECVDTKPHSKTG